MHYDARGTKAVAFKLVYTLTNDGMPSYLRFACRVHPGVTAEVEVPSNFGVAVAVPLLGMVSTSATDTAGRKVSIKRALTILRDGQR